MVSQNCLFFFFACCRTDVTGPQRLNLCSAPLFLMTLASGNVSDMLFTQPPYFIFFLVGVYSIRVYEEIGGGALGAAGPPSAVD